MARLDELERKFEENPRRYFAPLANEYRKAGEPQRAADLCRTQLPDIPGHISGHIVLGQALYDCRDYPGSRTALEAALALDPENIVALRYLGDIAMGLGETVEAERWYTRTLEADPYSEAAMSGLQSIAAAARRDAENPQLVATAAEQPDAPIAEPRLEPSPIDDPGIDKPAIKKPIIEPPVDEPFVEEPAVEEPAVEEPAVEEPAVEEPAVEEPPLEDPPVEEPSIDQPAIEDPMVEEVIVEPIVEPPMGEASIVEERVQGLGVERSLVEAPRVDVLSGDEPTAQDWDSLAREKSVAPVLIDETSTQFAGDLDVSAVADSPQATNDETGPGPAVEQGPPEGLIVVDVQAHAPPEPLITDEAIRAEERVLEAAAPFVTETMADLYLEQGYPHEALELLLQLSEQRPDDHALGIKIERIEAQIMDRRDAAVAVARAERAETQGTPNAPKAADIQDAIAPFELNEVSEVSEVSEVADALNALDALDALDALGAPSDATVAEIDAWAWDPAPADPTDATPAPTYRGQGGSPRMSVRELFARMDGARPRTATADLHKPAPMLRSDFAPMPAPLPGLATERAAHPIDEPSSVSRTSGSHQKFDPSTADIDDFDAWLRGLRGP